MSDNKSTGRIKIVRFEKSSRTLLVRWEIDDWNVLNGSRLKSSDVFGHDPNSMIQWQLHIFSSDSNSILVQKIDPASKNDTFSFWAAVFADHLVQARNQPFEASSSSMRLIKIPELHDFRLSKILYIRLAIKYLSPESLELRKPIERKTSYSFSHVSESFCDVQFELKKENQIKMLESHKILLSSKSDVFRRMFESPVTDPSVRNASIQITDVSYDSFKYFLDMLYGIERREYLDADTCLELLRIFDKYNIQDLKDDMEDVAVKMISIENLDLFSRAGQMFNCEKITKALLGLWPLTQVHPTRVSNFPSGHILDI